MTAKFSHHGNNDYELLKFNVFQDPLTSNSETFKALFTFWGPGKMDCYFQGRSRKSGHSCVTGM